MTAAREGIFRVRGNDGPGRHSAVGLHDAAAATAAEGDLMMVTEAFPPC